MTLEKTMNLIQILDNEHSLLKQILENEGEIFPELEALVRENSLLLTTKIDAYSKVMDRLKLEMEYRKQKLQKETEVYDGCEKTLERMKSCLKVAMQVSGKDELKGKDIRFKLVKSKPSMELRAGLEFKDCPKSFIRTKVVESLDKEAILNLAKSGQFKREIGLLIDFRENYALRIYPNTQDRKELE